MHRLLHQPTMVLRQSNRPSLLPSMKEGQPLLNQATGRITKRKQPRQQPVTMRDRHTFPPYSAPSPLLVTSRILKEPYDGSPMPTAATPPPPNARFSRSSPSASIFPPARAAAPSSAAAGPGFPPPSTKRSIPAAPTSPPSGSAKSSSAGSATACRNQLAPVVVAQVPLCPAIERSSITNLAHNQHQRRRPLARGENAPPRNPSPSSRKHRRRSPLRIPCRTTTIHSLRPSSSWAAASPVCRSGRPPSPFCARVGSQLAMSTTGCAPSSRSISMGPCTSPTSAARAPARGGGSNSKSRSDKAATGIAAEPPACEPAARRGRRSTADRS